MATREPASQGGNAYELNRVGQAVVTYYGGRRINTNGRMLGDYTPIGTVVGFREAIESGDEKWRGVVLEDRGDRVVTQDYNSTLPIPGQNVYSKRDLVSLGIEPKSADADKISSFKMTYEGRQDIVFGNGNVVSINHRGGSIPSYSLDVQRGPYKSSGEYEVYYNTQGVTRIEAMRRVKRELKRIAGIK